MYSQGSNPNTESVSKLKKTKLGLIFLLSAVSCYVVGIFGSIQGCITLVMNLAALGLGITAIVFLLLGSRAYGSSHKIMAIASVTLIGVAIIFRFFIVMMMVASMFSSIAGSLSETTSGDDYANLLESMKPYVLLMGIPYFMIAVGIILPTMKITPLWGKISGGVFLFFVVIALVVMVFVQINNIDSLVKDIDLQEEYDSEEIQDLQTERALKAWMSQLILAGAHMIAIIPIIGALLVNSKELSEARSRESSNVGIYSLNQPLI